MSQPIVPSVSDVVGFSSQQELGGGRTRRLLHGVLSAFFSKGVTILVNLVTIPIAIRYLGTESFGIWTTISTGLAMLLVLDLGVSNSLTNFISEAFARDDREHALTFITTALALMCTISAALGIIAFIVWPYISWNQVFHLSATAPREVSRSVASALLVFLVGLPASLAPKILGGYQELRTANVFAAVGSILNLVAVMVLVKLHAGLPVLVAASSGALVLSNVACLLWIFVLHKSWLRPSLSRLRRAAAQQMMQLGGEFFMIQIACLIVFNSDNLIVAHYLGPKDVVPYSVAWRLVGYAALVQTLLFPSLWPAFSEAFERGDYAWVRTTFRRTFLITIGTALVFSALFALGGRWITRVWASPAAVPSQTLILLMCVWILISTFMNNTATVLVAKGRTKLQAWCSLGAAILNITLSIHLVQRIGTPGVIAATIISYLLVLVVPQSITAWSVLHGDTL